MIGRETCQDYLKFWNVVDWLAIAFGITTVSLGYRCRRFWKLETLRPRTAFLWFPWWASSILQRGSKWFRFKGILEFRQHAGCSDACCYFIVWYFFKYKLLNLISQVVPGSVVFPRIVHHFAIKNWQVFLDGFCAESEWGVASNSRRAAIRCFGFCGFEQSVIPHCRGSRRDFDGWLGLIGVISDKSSKNM